MESFQNFSKLKALCRSLIQNHKNIESIKELNIIIKDAPQTFIKVVQPTILSTFYPILKSISEDKSSFRDNEKKLIVDTLKNLFDKSTIEKLVLFFNIYSFLLFEIYDHLQHKVLSIHEEYKLSIMECMTSLAKCISTELIFVLYTRENAPKLCQMLYVAVEVAKNDQLRSLRISAMKCIMSIARVLEDDDFGDIEVRNQVAEMFLFFLPGVATGLKKIALEDEKVGHRVPVVALTAWGRIITLLMQDYNASDEKIDILKIKNTLNGKFVHSDDKKNKFEGGEEIKEFLRTTKRTIHWYSDTDKKLQPLVIEFTKLTHHSHHKVRLELVNICGLITENCFSTMPRSLSHLIEIVLALSEDENDEVKQKCNDILGKLSSQLSSSSLKSLLENLEEGFYNDINRLPRKFNGIDEREQLTSLNLIIGYINLFGEHNLSQVLLSVTHLNKLMLTLIHISELEKSNISLLEEYTVKDLELTPNQRTPWKNFRHFKEDEIRDKLGKLCTLLAKFGTFRIISDFLLDTIMYHTENRKEAIFILNETISGITYNEENIQILKNILNIYTDNSYWQVPLSVGVNHFGYVSTLAEVQNNVIQVCLLVEGIGKMALALQKYFQEFLLKTLYLVLERAGSGHPLVKAAGLLALTNMTHACGYSSITDLINSNVDYFTYFVERKLNRIEDNESVLNVLAVVLKHSTIDVLPYIADIMKEVLLQSCDKFKDKNATAFLNLFKIFIQCLTLWFKIEIKIEPLKSKAEKLQEIEHFQVSGVSAEVENTFSDDIMEKSAEEMYQEDMAKKQKELEKEIEEPEIEEYKKPDPPLHIKLTVAILKRSLHFLPSKDRTRKLLVLNILSDGLEIIKDWEDELLPIVHQIWSPLVQRFKEFDDPLIINYKLLNKLSQESYLKDKGSAYRYSQAYKLQLMILENFGRILVDLDVLEEKLNEAMDSGFNYISDKQPIPLQAACIEFFKVLANYDPEMVRSKVTFWQKENVNNEYEKNIKQICSFLDQIN
ncbi:hypothetical protein NQ314_006300 [Rhamnusium bicolor]|uniref:TELO2-interacting protein 1 homolog n=1 Tax=Rhamnusium bicolor TaxID=1586634 RepID=A0AAV8Z6U9_9CUCU|nr:hypothetical protein NQ314_006300 [Rhamnusium bicolor]